MLPNRYRQLITSQLQSISQIDTQKFLIRIQRYNSKSSAGFAFIQKQHADFFC